MKYVRMYGDSNGESHFEDVHLDFALGDYSPPTPPVHVSPFAPATQFGFLGVPSGWVGDWHPVPRRQLFFIVAGEMEVEVSDGEVRRLPVGSVLLTEDTFGRGHVSRVVGAEDCSLAVVHLPD